MLVGGGIHIIFYKRGLCLYLLRSIFLLKNVWDILANWTTCTTLNEQSFHDSPWPVCICLCLLWLPFHPNRSKQMTPPSRVGVCSRFFARLGSVLPLFGAAPERSAGFLSDCAKHCEVPVDVFCALLIKVDWLIDWKPCEGTITSARTTWANQTMYCRYVCRQSHRALLKQTQNIF